MSKLDKFLAKPVEVEVMGDKYMVRPLTVAELPLITRAESKDPIIASKAAKELTFLIFKQIVPEATIEDYEKVGIEVVKELMMAMAKANGADTSEIRQKLGLD